MAAQAILPEKLGRLTDAVAEILELHMEALELADENSRLEHAAYAELASNHRRIARELLATAERMTGYRELPMGTHDEAAFADPRHFDAFARFVSLETELLALLDSRLADDRKMLSQMRGDDLGDSR